MNEMKPILQEISFDGINFWMRDIKIGKIKKDLRFVSAIPKETMQEEKFRCIGKIIGMQNGESI